MAKPKADLEREHYDLTIRVLAPASEYDAMLDASQDIVEEHLAEVGEACAERVGKDYAMLTLDANAFFVDSIEDEVLNPFVPCEFEMFEKGDGLVDGTTWEYYPHAPQGLLMGTRKSGEVELLAPEEILEGLAKRGADKPWAGCPIDRPAYDKMGSDRGQEDIPPAWDM